MKKFLLILLMMCGLLGHTFSQEKIDTIIRTTIYSSYFSKKLKVPVFVSYKLWKGGGKESREGMDFWNDTEVQMATSEDYMGTGFDKGHLAPAKDFSSNRKFLELTFRFYNCLPQTPNLNRGIWKKVETELRLQSQSDSLLIVCGGLFENLKLKIGSGVAVPTRCWKVSKNLRTSKVEHVWIFTNDPVRALYREITLDQLEKLLRRKVPLQ